MWRLLPARLPARAAADGRRLRARRCSPALPDALLALWLALLGRRRASSRTIALVTVAAVGLAVSAPLTWLLRYCRTRLQRRFRDKVTIALESHVARLQASVATIAHQERPDYLDRLVGAARPGLRARPHVHVGVLHAAAGSCGSASRSRC